MNDKNKKKLIGNESLLACPCCEAKSEFVFISRSTIMSRIVCPECGIKTFDHTDREYLKKVWNNRQGRNQIFKTHPS